jgi:hypothetical protein
MPTVDEEDLLDGSQHRRGSGPTPVSPKLKSLRVSGQPSSEKVMSSKKKSKSPREGDEDLEPHPSNHLVAHSKFASSASEVPVFRETDGHHSASDDESPSIPKKKKLIRPASSNDMILDGLIDSPASLASTASPKSNRRKSSRRNGSGAAVSGDAPADDRKRLASSTLSASSSMSSTTSSSSVQSSSVASPMVNKAAMSIHKALEGLPTLILPSISFSSSSMAPPSPPVQVEHTKQLTAALLIDVLRSPRHLAMLKAQMVKERCDENLDFWLDTQRLWFSFQLQKLETNANIEPETVLAHGMHIYNNYVENLALNLPAKVGAKLRHAFKVATPNFPITTSLFLEAQTVSFKVIEADPFPRFLKATGVVASPSSSSSVLANSPTSTSGTKRDKSEGFNDLIQLSAPGQITSDLDDFLAQLDECNRNTKLKWSKISDDRSTGHHQFKVQKVEYHGIHHLRASAQFLSSSDPEAIANYMADTQLWRRWLHPGCTILELERLSPLVSVIWLAWSKNSSKGSSGETSKDSSSKDAAKHSISPPNPSSFPASFQGKKYDRYMVLYVAVQHDTNRSTVIFCSLPHSTAPTPPNAVKCSLLVSGFKIESTGPTPNDPISIEMLFRAEKSEFKKWDKDSLIYADALHNLQNMLR